MEDLTTNSDNLMGYLEGRISSQEVLKQIKGNETINLNGKIGSFKGRIQLAWSEQS